MTLPFPDGEKPTNAFNSQMWEFRSHQYDKLGWVNAGGPMERLAEMANFQPGETVIDVGTGSQAILNKIAPSGTPGQIIGFDISKDMLGAEKVPGRFLQVADATRMPYPNDFADLITARMVLHHMPKPALPIQESFRVLKPSGRLIVGEYVASDDEVWTFERKVFDIKEPGRHLWTGSGLAKLVSAALNDEYEELSIGYGVMEQYSVKDWMSKSGLSQDIQNAVLEEYLKAPQSIIEKMGIIYKNGDAFVDRPFAFVRAVK